jgi:hypothetical protein
MINPIELSTMTLDGMITNVRFDKENTIKHLTLTKNIVEIGCNYGHIISEEYKKMPNYKNRIKKKTEKVYDTRKKQGLGTHFNSQITFTIISDIDAEHTYQVKLFTNGRVQIPGIGKCIKGNHLLVNEMLTIITSYIKVHPVLMHRENKPLTVINLIPILQNYKSITLGASNCKKETKYYLDKHNKEKLSPPLLHLSMLEMLFIKHKQNRDLSIGVNNAVFHAERYAGMLIKFSTPKIYYNQYKLDKLIEMVKLYYQAKVRRIKLKPISISDTDDKMTTIVKMIQNAWATNNKCFKKLKQKLTTVKLFKTGKINIDHVNNKEQAIMIRDIVIHEINKNWDTVVYYENESYQKLTNNEEHENAMMHSEDDKDLYYGPITYENYIYNKEIEYKQLQQKKLSLFNEKFNASYENHRLYNIYWDNYDMVYYDSDYDSNYEYEYDPDEESTTKLTDEEYLEECAMFDEDIQHMYFGPKTYEDTIYKKKYIESKLGYTSCTMETVTYVPPSPLSIEVVEDFVEEFDMYDLE